MFKLIARKIVAYPRWTVAIAAILLVVAVTVGTGVFSRLISEGFMANGSDSAKVQAIVDEKFGTGADALALLTPKHAGIVVTDPAYKRAAEQVIADIAEHQDVAAVTSYYSTGASSFVSRDKTKTFLAIEFTKDADAEARAQELVTGIKSDILDVSFTGSAVINHDISAQIEHDLARAEIASFGILAVLLVLVFRSFVAAGLPLLLGAFTIMVSFLLLFALSQVTTVSQYAINVIIALGLGLSIDYSLLIVSRFREELTRRNATVKKAIIETLHTAGHTVFFSGLTVIICLLALAIFPIDMLRSMGLGGASAVVAAMFAGLIVLPALLTLLGRRINSLSWGKFKQRARQGTAPEYSAFWHKLTAMTTKRPVLFVIPTLLLLIFAGLPVLHLQLGDVDQTVLPGAAESRQAIETIDRDFERDNAQITVVYTAKELKSAQAIGDLYGYTEALGKVTNVTNVSGVTKIAGVTMAKSEYQAVISHPAAAPPALREQMDSLMKDDTTVITVGHDPELTHAEKASLVEAIRDVPQPSTATTILVGGITAALVDQMSAITSHLPGAVAWIMVSIFILMFLMLGSVVLPIKAMLLNALSLSISIGAVVWIFQEGHLADVFGFNDTSGISVTQPLIIFAIAFGLSMDYSVFLYGRIKEEYDLSGNTKQAIAAGLTKTGGIITSAAILLFVVVAAFASSQIAVMQQIGVGLAVAVLVDAFVVRVLLVPATMALFGTWNWWAPKALKRLHQRLGLDGRH